MGVRDRGEARIHWRALPAGIVAGTSLGWCAAVVEWILRCLVSGHSGWGRMASALLVVPGVYAGLGAVAGGLAGLASATLYRRGSDPALRAARGSLALELTAALVLALHASSWAPASRGLMLLVTAAVLVGVAALSWVVRRPVERIFSPIVEGRTLRLFLAPLVALSILAALPRVLLTEPVETVDPSWRVATVFSGLIAAGLLLFVLALFPSAGARVDSRVGRLVLVYVLLSSLVSVATGFRPAGHRPAREKPNVLLIVVDTVRPDHLSAYGYSRSTSPALDALAGRGVLFTDAVTPASFTMPAMASLFTSRWPYQHAVRCHPSRLAPEEVTLAEAFRESGYVTGAVVSNLLLSRQWGFDQGFTFYDVFREPSLGPGAGFLLMKGFDLWARGERADDTARQAVRWLARHRRRAFFLWVHFMDPHFPYEPPPPYDHLFGATPAGGDHDRATASDAGSDPQREYAALMEAYRNDFRSRGELAVGRVLSPAILAEGTARYDGEIAYADAGVARLLRALDRLGLAETTLVLYASDHGESLGEHGVNFAHTFTTYESMMRVPLVIAGSPRLASGTRVSRQVDLLDVAPTLLSLAGVHVPQPMRGRNVISLLETGPGRETAAPARPAYGENAPLLPGHPSYSLIASFSGMYREGMEGKWRMVRRPPWKLIHVPGRPGGEDLLFDLLQDPAEENDLATSAPDTLRAMQAALAVFSAEETASTSPSLPGVDAATARELRSLGYIH